MLLTARVGAIGPSHKQLTTKDVSDSKLAVAAGRSDLDEKAEYER